MAIKAKFEFYEIPNCHMFEGLESYFENFKMADFSSSNFHPICSVEKKKNENGFSGNIKIGALATKFPRKVGGCGFHTGDFKIAIMQYNLLRTWPWGICKFTIVHPCRFDTICGPIRCLVTFWRA